MRRVTHGGPAPGIAQEQARLGQRAGRPRNRGRPPPTRVVLRIFRGTVFGWLRRTAARRGVVGDRCGAVTAIQRFGGALNANIHSHSLVLDGV